MEVKLNTGNLTVGRLIFLVLILAAVYFAAAKFGLSLATLQKNASPVWPPTGIALAAVLVWGGRISPGIFLGALLANLTTGIPLGASIGIALGNTLEALAAAWLVRRYARGAHWLESVYGVAAFLFGACLAATLISAAIGTYSLWQAGVIDAAISVDVAWTWWLGDAMGALLLTPLLLVWREPRQALNGTGNAWEKITITVAFVAVGLFAFGVVSPATNLNMPFVFLALPVMLWAALRWTQAGVTLGALLLSIFAISGTLRGYGPFVSDNVNESLVLLQSFLGLITACGLFGAAAVTERMAGERMESEARDALEDNVFERTRDLLDSQEKQAIISKLLQLGLEELPSEAKYIRALEVISGISWLKQSPKTGLFLIEPESGDLRLVAHLNFPEAQVQSCDRVAIGYCCCGRAARERHIIHHQHMDHDHDIQWSGITDHGHFNVPVIAGTSLLGVIVLYMDVNHVRQPAEESFLKSIAATLAVIIVRSTTQQTLKTAASVFEKSEQGIMIASADASIQQINRAFTKITGYSADEAIGQTPRMLKSNRHDQAFYQSLWQTLNEAGSWEGEIWNRRKNGEVYPEWLSITAVKDEQDVVSSYIGIFTDISEKKLREARIRHLAHYDVLTELPNRALFTERLEQALSYAHRSGKTVAVLFMDLDRFKLINDSQGHLAGDALLQTVAGRLVDCVRQEDTVARPGGDEFAIILNEVSSIEAVALVAKKLCARVAEPLDLDGMQTKITASIGISLYPADDIDPVSLLRNADTAMYRAKEAGGNLHRFYTEDMNRAIVERMRMESNLEEAIRERQFVLHYQPQVRASDGHIVGVEALIRWEHPQLGTVSPAQFIPVAEDSGLIVEIGQWVLTEACRQQSEWHRAGFGELRMAVNLSVKQFVDPGLIALVQSQLDGVCTRPEKLELEVTESSLMTDPQKAMALLRRIHAMGVGLAIDDFGVAYSSLNQLKRMPVDRLKIDQSFVREVTESEPDAAIVSTIIAIGQRLKLKVIAEGVETEAQYRHLKSLGCDEMQGYYFSRPQPADEIEPLLRRDQPLP